MEHNIKISFRLDTTNCFWQTSTTSCATIEKELKENLALKGTMPSNLLIVNEVTRKLSTLNEVNVMTLTDDHKSSICDGEPCQHDTMIPPRLWHRCSGGAPVHTTLPWSPPPTFCTHFYTPLNWMLSCTNSPDSHHRSEGIRRSLGFCLVCLYNSTGMK